MRKMNNLHQFLNHVSRSLVMGSIFFRAIFIIKENFAFPKDPSESFLSQRVMNGGLMGHHGVDKT